MDDVRAVLDAVGSTSTRRSSARKTAARWRRSSRRRIRSGRGRSRSSTRSFIFRRTSEESGDRRSPRSARGGARRSSATRCSPGMLPDSLSSPEERQWFANLGSRRCKPGVAYALNRAWGDTDLREVLPAVRVPTIVLYREGQYYEQYALDVAKLHSRRAGASSLRQRLRGASSCSPEIPDEVERFVTGEVAPEVPDTRARDADVHRHRRFDRARRPSSATTPGGRCSSDTTRLVRRELARFAATRRTPPVTASSRPSTGRRARSAARTRSSTACASSGSRFAPASTRASASCTRARSPGSPSSIGARVAARRRRG